MMTTTKITARRTSTRTRTDDMSQQRTCVSSLPAPPSGETACVEAGSKKADLPALRKRRQNLRACCIFLIRLTRTTPIWVFAGPHSIAGLLYRVAALPSPSRAVVAIQQYRQLRARKRSKPNAVTTSARGHEHASSRPRLDRFSPIAEAIGDGRRLADHEAAMSDYKRTAPRRLHRFVTDAQAPRGAFV